MKTLFLTFCLFVLINPALTAQIVDRSLSFGFITAPCVVKPIGENQWLVVGKGMPYRGGYYDNYFAQVFDQQGDISSTLSLQSPGGEINNVFDAWPLADSTFIVLSGSRPCDTGYDGTVLQKYAPNGQLLWTLWGTLWNNNNLPYFWKIAPDGNLLGLRADEMWKVDVSNGSVIWKAKLTGLNANPLPFYFDLLPGSEDFLGLGTHDFQIWKKLEGPNGPIYNMQNALVTDNYYGFGFASNGWYYARRYSTNHLERINANLELEILNTSINLNGSIQMAAVSDGLYFLGRTNEQNWLRKTNFVGKNPMDLHMPDLWLTGRSVAVRGDSVVVVGTEGSGPKNAEFYDFFYSESFQTLHLWLRTITGPTAVPSTDTVNASVTGLQQLSLVDTVFQPSWPNNYFALHGGNFQVQITNRGNTTLEKVYVNFSYEPVQDVFCPSTPADQRFFTGLQIAPGESTWINFGDLAFPNLSTLSPEFCFWTSAPNGQPDAHHEDDWYCQPATYTVTAHSPSTLALNLLPTPTQDFFYVNNFTSPQDTEWQLYNAAGRLVQKGIYPAGKSNLAISTQSLANGFYIFHIANQTAKLIVKH